MDHRMNTFCRAIFLASGLVCALSSNRAQGFDQLAFDRWVADFQQSAIKQGIDPELLDRALGGLRPRLSVLQSDKKQPEFMLGFWEYYSRGVSENRIRLGRKMREENAALFTDIAEKYHVQPRFLIALWGLESHFGQVKGDIPLVQSLATLAFDPRRGRFFRNELMQLLHILDNQHFALEEAVGSWAGAFGHTQFMPSTHANYGVDADEDGKIHLIESKVDALHSAANYLQRLGWDANKTWGREVILPKNFDYGLARFDLKKKLSFWHDRGVRTTSNTPLPQVDVEASLLVPTGAEGPAFLVYENFRRIMQWNNSLFFALNVGLLSDAIADRATLKWEKPRNYAALKTQEILQIQRTLNRLGFDAGTPDGIIGRQTRKALRDFQKAHSLPADGYPGVQTRTKLQNSS